MGSLRYLHLPISFLNNNSPAVFNNGNASALLQRTHDADGGTIQFFDDPKVVFDAQNPTSGVLRNPRNGEFGSRNALLGSGFWNLDTSLMKSFKMPWSERHELRVIWQTFNAFNHNSFGLPNANISSPAFGQITTSASTPRDMQFALRYQF
jgi:hypothetical protein